MLPLRLTAPTTGIVPEPPPPVPSPFPRLSTWRFLALPPMKVSSTSTMPMSLRNSALARPVRMRWPSRPQLDEVEACWQRVTRINESIADFDWRMLYMVEYYGFPVRFQGHSRSGTGGMSDEGVMEKD
jgi:hypothetical protein